MSFFVTSNKLARISEVLKTGVIATYISRRKTMATNDSNLLLIVEAARILEQNGTDPNHSGKNSTA